MRVNGYINLQLETGGGTDPVTGFPVPVTKYWSGNIPCCYLANQSASRGAYIDGEFTIASYSIDIEMQELPPFDTLRLVDLRGNILGAGDEEERTLTVVTTPEYLDTVERIRILV